MYNTTVLYVELDTKYFSMIFMRRGVIRQYFESIYTRSIAPLQCKNKNAFFVFLQTLSACMRCCCRGRLTESRNTTPRQELDDGASEADIAVSVSRGRSDKPFILWIGFSIGSRSSGGSLMSECGSSKCVFCERGDAYPDRESLLVRMIYTYVFLKDSCSCAGSTRWCQGSRKYVNT